jgi:putative oxidoreductase
MCRGALAALAVTAARTESVIAGIYRPVAFILSGEMAVAYFMSHAPRGFFPISMGGNGGELAIIYCFIFLYFFFVGAGVWSLDSLRLSQQSNPVSQ